MAAKTNKTAYVAGAKAGGWARTAQDLRDARRVPVGRPIRHIPPQRTRRAPGRR